MTLNLQLPKRRALQPNITVFGVGGAGCNAVNNMIKSSLGGVNFVVANTDAQALEHSQTDRKIQLGETITQGLGAGSYPEVGRASAEESFNEIMINLEGSNMIFITAGMGGGTGTGAAPVIARLAREQGILTVAVVTKPFHFEGSNRMRVAEMGLDELQKFVDTLIVIPNQNLFRVADKKTTFAEAFKMADDVLHAGVRGITDLMVTPGLINLDFADVRAVMSEMGKAMMGTGEAEGETRAIQAAEAAISNPLLDNASMKGARGVLINITGGSDMTLFEVDEAANRIREEVDQEANIIFGSAFNSTLEGKIRVSVVATGIEPLQPPQQEPVETLKPQPQVFKPFTVADRASFSGPAEFPARNTSTFSFGNKEPAQPQPKEPQPRIYGLYQSWQKQEPVSSAELKQSQAENRGIDDFFTMPPAAEPETFEKVNFSPVTAQQSSPQAGIIQDSKPMATEIFGERRLPEPSMEKPAAPQPKGFGLFSRIGLGRAPAEQLRAPEPVSEPKAAPHISVRDPETPRSSNELQQDMLDIPAYLRRNAN